MISMSVFGLYVCIFGFNCQHFLFIVNTRYKLTFRDANQVPRCAGNRSILYYFRVRTAWVIINVNYLKIMLSRRTVKGVMKFGSRHMFKKTLNNLYSKTSAYYVTWLKQKFRIFSTSVLLSTVFMRRSCEQQVKHVFCSTFTQIWRTSFDRFLQFLKSSQELSPGVALETAAVLQVLMLKFIKNQEFNRATWLRSYQVT